MNIQPSQTTRFKSFAIAAITVASGAAVLPAAAQEVPFSEGQVLVQLNDTDEDLGFHARIDGDPWERLTIEGPDERKLLNLRLSGRLRRQGLTELAFESAEPNFDDFSPEQFFARFPEGEYEIEGISADGTEYESISELSHVLPAPPEDLSVDGMPAPEDCDGGLPTVAAGSPIVIAWGEVDSSHPDVGAAGDVEIDSYELAVEGENVDYTVNVDADTTAVVLSSLPAGEYKYQVLVREERGNETSSESCFIVE